MVEHLPEIYVSVRERYPEMGLALDSLGSALEGAGPLDVRAQRLVKLGIAVGAESQGAVRSNVRKALGVGISPDEIRHAILLAVTTAGFPAMVAGLGWAEEVLSEEM